MNKLSLISVIVPVYNVEKFLEKCLNSIVNQTYNNLEIICVNDGSQDNSDKILNKYAQKDKRIKIINQENGGLSVARNTGLDNATGDWISFVDSDDYIALDYYETMINAAKASGADVVQCGHSVFSNKINKTYTYKPTVVDGFTNIIKEFRRGYVWNKLWKRELIENNNLRFYPKIYIEDILFSVGAANFISKLEVIKYVGNFYRINPTSITQSHEKKEKIKKDIYFICCEALNLARKHGCSNEEINVLSTFLIGNLISYDDISDKQTFRKYKKLFPYNLLLLKKNYKVKRRKIIRLAVNKREFIICSYNLIKFCDNMFVNIKKIFNTIKKKKLI